MEHLTFLGIAFILGFRHGVDWDHIAALTDLVGSTAEGQTPAKNAMTLSLLYAAGHALVVALLGSAALAFAAVLPAWVDPFMERMVGVTLVLLACSVVYSLVNGLHKHPSFRLQSRWMLLADLVRRVTARVRGVKPPIQSTNCGPLGAFSIGMIHGIGAETGTQILLLAAVGGQHDLQRGLMMLFSFVIGLIASNSLVAFAAAGGVRLSLKIRPLYLVSCTMVAMFSFIVGTFFLFGQADNLPNLQSALNLHLVSMF